MNINRSGNKKQGGTFKCSSTEEITPNQMRLIRFLSCMIFCSHSAPVWLRSLISLRKVDY